MEFQKSFWVNEEDYAGKEFLYKTEASILPWKQNMGPTPADEIIPYIITLPLPNFTVFLRHWGDKHFPFLRLTNPFPSDTNKLNLDSSLKWTAFHCSSVPPGCAMWQSQDEPFHFSLESKVFRHGIRAINLSLFNLWEAAFQDIGFRICSQNVQERGRYCLETVF